MSTSDILKKHPYPVAAWIAMVLGHDSPDSRVQVDKVTPLPDRCSLTFDYFTVQSPEAILDGGLVTEPVEDFYVGEPPRLLRLMVTGETGDPVGSRVIAHWRVCSECAVYRAESRTLYVCAPTRAM
jgi:hypothetical protein